MRLLLVLLHVVPVQPYARGSKPRAKNLIRRRRSSCGQRAQSTTNDNLGFLCECARAHSTCTDDDELMLAAAFATYDGGDEGGGSEEARAATTPPLQPPPPEVLFDGGGTRAPHKLARQRATRVKRRAAISSAVCKRGARAYSLAALCR